MNDLIVGTAGHIDHGKTALVRALTGIDTDRLAEEKKRGITIDIGFAHTQLGKYRVGFIDVPGHERFIKNMLAGIGGIHLLLLVVAADESIMPQTVEHFQICKLLEIPSGIIVITKKNQVDQDLLSLVKEEARDLVRNSQLETAPIVSVDSLLGEGLDELKEAMRKQIERLDQDGLLAPPIERVFRLPIDRVFTVKGFGTVVTGTPQGGEIHQDETIAVYPGGQTGKIRGIQIFGEKTEKARAGQRTALNLVGLDKEILERGMVLGAPKILPVSHIFDTSIHLLETAPRTLNHRDPVRFHHGSGELLGRVYLLESPRLEPGQKMLAQIRLEKPTVCLPGDRFVLRRYSPLTTIGGGLVLAGNPPKRRKNGLKEQLPRLRALESALETPDVTNLGTLIEYHVDQSGIIGIDLRALGSVTGLNGPTLQSILEELGTVIIVPMEPPLIVTKANVKRIQEQIIEYLRSYHRTKPLTVGASREELKERFLPGGGSLYFQFLLNSWQQAGLVEIRGGCVALHGSEVLLDAEQETTRKSILEIVERFGLNAPTLEEIMEQSNENKENVRNIFFYLLQTGEILRVSGDMVLQPSQLKQLEEELRSSFPAGNAFTVTEFKSLFSLSRKYAIPLLELLDRKKVTRRVGDKRMVI